MSSGYTFIGQAVGVEKEPIVTGIAVAGLIVVVAALGTLQLRRAKDSIIPEDRLTFRKFGELLCGFILKLCDDIMGKENRKYIPFLGTLFFFILSLNMIGLVPGVATATGGDINRNLAFNFGLAVTVFIFYHIAGLRSGGVKNYAIHFMGGPVFVKGPMIIMGVILAFIEIISHCVRPVSLSVRLFANMTADHIVLGIFTNLTKVVVPVIFYWLGTFVSVMQAFLFTVLSMVYIKIAVTHEDHEEGHNEAHNQ